MEHTRLVPRYDVLFIFCSRYSQTSVIANPILAAKETALCFHLFGISGASLEISLLAISGSQASLEGRAVQRITRHKTSSYEIDFKLIPSPCASKVSAKA
jgi:hypothetical protein